MKIIEKLLLVMVLIIGFGYESGPARAELVKIGESVRGSKGVDYIYVDTDYIHKNGPFVWFVQELVGRDNGGGVKFHSRSMNSGDCRTGRIRTRVLKQFYPVEKTYDYGTSKPARRVVPGSMGESVLNFVCNY